MNNKTWILLCQILCGLLDSLLLVVSFKLSYLIRLRLPYYKGGSLPFLGEGVDAVMPFFIVG